MDWPVMDSPDDSVSTLPASWSVAHKGAATARDKAAGPVVMRRPPGLPSPVVQVTGAVVQCHNDPAPSPYDNGLWSGSAVQPSTLRPPSRPKCGPHALETIHSSSSPPPAEVSFAGQAAAPYCTPDKSDELGEPQRLLLAHILKLARAKQATTEPGLHQSSNQQHLAELASRDPAGQTSGNNEVALLRGELTLVRAEKCALQKELTEAQQAHALEAQQARQWEVLLDEAKELAATAVACSDRKHQQLQNAKQAAARGRQLLQQRKQMEAAAAAALAESQRTADRLQQEVAELSTELQDAVQARGAADSSNNSLSEEVAAMTLQLQQQQDGSRRELAVVLDSNAQLGRQVVTLSNTVRELEAENAAAQDMCDQLKAQQKQMLKALRKYQQAAQPCRQLGPLSSMRWLFSKDARDNSSDAVTATRTLLTEMQPFLTAAGEEADEEAAEEADESLDDDGLEADGSLDNDGLVDGS